MFTIFLLLCLANSSWPTIDFYYPIDIWLPYPLIFVNSLCCFFNSPVHSNYTFFFLLIKKICHLHLSTPHIIKITNFLSNTTEQTWKCMDCICLCRYFNLIDLLRNYKPLIIYLILFIYNMFIIQANNLKLCNEIFNFS